MAIRNLIFDVGSVLLDYRWDEMLIEERGLSKERAQEVGTAAFNDGFWDEFDAGLLSVEELTARECKLHPLLADDITWFLNNPEHMGVFRPALYDKIHELKEKGYGIYILSNYSEKFFKAHTSGAAFWQDVDGLVVSYEVHLLKPDIRIYEYLLNKYSLKANESIFFDDRSANVEGAKAAGIEAFLVTGEKMLIEKLGEF